MSIRRHFSERQIPSTSDLNAAKQPASATARASGRDMSFLGASGRRLSAGSTTSTTGAAKQIPVSLLKLHAAHADALVLAGRLPCCCFRSQGTTLSRLYFAAQRRPSVWRADIEATGEYVVGSMLSFCTVSDCSQPCNSHQDVERTKI